MAKFQFDIQNHMSNFDLLPTGVSQANDSFESLVDFLQRNNCIDLAVQLLEREMNTAKEKRYQYTLGFLYSFRHKKVDELFKLADKNVRCTQTIKDLAEILRISLVNLNGWSKTSSDRVVDSYLDFLRALRVKSRQSWLQNFMSDLGWTSIARILTMIFIALM